MTWLDKMLGKNRDRQRRQVYDLSDLEVFEVSIVDSPAVPAATFAMLKSKNAPEGKVPFVREFKIDKLDEDEQIAYGYYLVPDEVDHQDDTCSAATVRAAAHSYMKNLALGNSKGDGVGYNHELFKDIGYPVESVIDPDGSIGRSFGLADKAKPGGWFGGMKITNADLWKRCKSGEATGFSIGGWGRRTEVAASLNSDFGQYPDEGMLKAMGTMLGQMFGVGKVTDFNTTLWAQRIGDRLPEYCDYLFWTVLDIANTHEPLTPEARAKAIMEAIRQFTAAVAALLEIDAEKMLKTMAERLSPKAGDLIETFHYFRHCQHGYEEIEPGTIKLAQLNEQSEKGLTIVTARLKGASAQPCMIAILFAKEVEGAEAWTRDKATKWLSEHAADIATNDLLKTSQGDEEMTKEEFAKLFKEAFTEASKPLLEKIDSMETKLNAQPKLEETEFGKMVGKSIVNIGKGLQALGEIKLGTAGKPDDDKPKDDKKTSKKDDRPADERLKDSLAGSAFDIDAISARISG